MKDEIIELLECFSEEEIDKAFYDGHISGLIATEAKQNKRENEAKRIEQSKKPRIYDPNAYHRYIGYKSIEAFDEQKGETP